MQFSIKNMVYKTLNVSALVIFAFFPKCPICWAAYGGLLGSLGLTNLDFNGWYIVFPLGLVLVSFVFMASRIKLNGIFPLAHLIGVLIIIANYFTLKIIIITYLAIAITIIASIGIVFSSIRFTTMYKNNCGFGV